MADSKHGVSAPQETDDETFPEIRAEFSKRGETRHSNCVVWLAKRWEAAVKNLGCEQNTL